MIKLHNDMEMIFAKNQEKLFCTTFRMHKKNKELNSRYIRVLKKNLQNKSFTKYFLFLEGEFNEELHNLEKDKRLTIKKIFERPTFSEILGSLKFPKGSKVFLCNGDIIIPNQESLDLLLNKNFKSYSIALTRYDFFYSLPYEWRNKTKGLEKNYKGTKLRTCLDKGCSIDSWILEFPLNLSSINADILMGTVESDGYFSGELKKKGGVFNPCLDILTIHYHPNWDPQNYASFKVFNKIYTRKEWNSFMKSKGYRRKCIPFCKLDIIP